MMMKDAERFGHTPPTVSSEKVLNHFIMNFECLAYFLCYLLMYEVFEFKVMYLHAY